MPARAAPQTARPPALAAILAGGRGSRMGRPKALAELGGRPLISYPLAAAERAGLEAVVMAKPGSELPPLGCRVSRAEAPRQHPIAGLVAALELATPRALIVVACDMPFVAPDLLRWLAAGRASVAVPSVRGRMHPLLARYESSVSGVLADALAHGLAVREAVTSLGPARVTEAELRRFGDPQRILFNVNTPRDLRTAERMLGETLLAAEAVE